MEQSNQQIGIEDAGYEAILVNYMRYNLLVFGIDKSYILWYSPVLEGGENHAERKNTS